MDDEFTRPHPIHPDKFVGTFIHVVRHPLGDDWLNVPSSLHPMGFAVNRKYPGWLLHLPGEMRGGARQGAPKATLSPFLNCPWGKFHSPLLVPSFSPKSVSRWMDVSWGMDVVHSLLHAPLSPCPLLLCSSMTCPNLYIYIHISSFFELVRYFHFF